LIDRFVACLIYLRQRPHPEPLGYSWSSPLGYIYKAAWVSTLAAAWVQFITSHLS